MCKQKCKDKVMIAVMWFCFFMFAAFCLQAGDVEVCYARYGSWRYACFQQDVHVISKAGGTQRLNEALCDEMLAGYSFLPEIPFWHAPEKLMQSGVREHVCLCYDFFSENMEGFFKQMKEILSFESDREKCLVDKRPQGKKLRAADVDAYIYPPGMTRLWRVVPRESLWVLLYQDRVFVSVEGEKYMLEGILRKRQALQKPPPRNLLCLKKQLKQRAGEKIGGVTLSVRVPVGDVFSQHELRCDALESCESGCAVGIACCSGGAWEGGLFDLSGLTCYLHWRRFYHYCRETTTLFDSVRHATLQGSCLRYPLRGAINVDYFEDYDVQKATCIKVPFSSDRLRYLLTEYKRYVFDSSRCIADACWPGLRCESFEAMFAGTNTLRWDIVDKGVLLRWYFEEKALPDGSVVVVVQGLPVGFCGMRQKKTSDEIELTPSSLMDYKCLNKIRAEVYA